MGLNFFDAWNISIHSPYTGRDYYERRYDEAVDISIHSPYTGRDKMYIVYTDYTGISIHSPYTGRDASECPAPLLPGYFNPLSLYRERRRGGTGTGPAGCISIHSPYTGRDAFGAVGAALQREFQSTLPIQGETMIDGRMTSKKAFQSTLPIQGETSLWVRSTILTGYFNPLSLYRERRFQAS